MKTFLEKTSKNMSFMKSCNSIIEQLFGKQNVVNFQKSIDEDGYDSETLKDEINDNDDIYNIGCLTYIDNNLKEKVFKSLKEYCEGNIILDNRYKIIIKAFDLKAVNYHLQNMNNYDKIGAKLQLNLYNLCNYQHPLIKNNNINPLYILMIITVKMGYPFSCHLIDSYLRYKISYINNNKNIKPESFVNTIIGTTYTNKKLIFSMIDDYFQRTFKPIQTDIRLYPENSKIIDDNINQYILWLNCINNHIYKNILKKNKYGIQIDLVILPKKILQRNGKYPYKYIRKSFGEIGDLHGNLKEFGIEGFKRNNNETYHAFFNKIIKKYGEFKPFNRYIIVIDRRIYKTNLNSTNNDEIIYIINLKNNSKYGKHFKVDKYCLDRNLSETFNYNSLYYLIPSSKYDNKGKKYKKRQLSKVINTSMSGFNFTISYHIPKPRNNKNIVRMYQHWNEQYFRFFKDDIKNIWIKYYFKQQNFDNNLYNELKCFRENEFELFYKKIIGIKLKNINGSINKSYSMINNYNLSKNDYDIAIDDAENIYDKFEKFIDAFFDLPGTPNLSNDIRNELNRVSLLDNVNYVNARTILNDIYQKLERVSQIINNNTNTPS